MGRIDKLKREAINEANIRVLNEQIEPTTITPKELLKLGEKGWSPLAGGSPVSNYVNMANTFTVIDGRGGHIEGAKLDADAKLRNSGIKQKRTFVIQKEEGNNVLVKYVMITK